MLFDEFINKWNSRGIDFDGAYGDQCMDLMHQYVSEVLGVTDGRVLAAPAAKDVYLNFDNIFGHDQFEKIANTPTGVPQKGDIILWGTGVGQYGHVAVFVSGDANNFKSFDQNWPVGSKCHLQDHNYNGVLGWLRFKGQPTGGTEMYNGYDLSNRESMKVAVDVLVRVQKGEFVDKAKYDAEIKSKQDTIDNLNQQINDRNNDIIQLNSAKSTLEAQVLDLTTQLETASGQAILVPDLKKENEALTEKVGKYVEAEKSWNRARAQYESQLTELRAQSVWTLLRLLLSKIKGGDSK